jgi:L-alanine-DL-glutamate epimerase-like enolase superfamily enzyme
VNEIQKIEVFPLRYPESNDGDRLRCITLVRIESSDGAVGWGEAITRHPEAAKAVKTLIDEGLGAILRGRDPQNLRQHVRRLEQHCFWDGNGGIASFAISALDIALWDLAGKLCGLPVYALLGGKSQDRAVACASVILDTLNVPQVQEDYLSYCARGFTAIKGGWGLVAEAGFGTDEKRDLALAHGLRDTVGDDIGLAFDVSLHAAWSQSHAVRMAEQLQSVSPLWLEDALDHEDYEGYRRIRSRVATPIATGERCWTLSDYQRLLHHSCVDLILVDPGRVQGISGMKRIVDDAATHGVGFVPHSWSSAINTAAALHVYAASENGVAFEIKPQRNIMQHDLVSQPIENTGAWIETPASPGLGLEIDEGIVRKYALA